MEIARSLPSLQSILTELEKETTSVKKSFTAHEIQVEDKEFSLFLKREELKQVLLGDAQTIDKLNKHCFIDGSPDIHVEFLNLKSIYEKAQCRINRQSRQKILNAKVNMVVTFDAQIQDIAVMVGRIPESRALCGDTKCGEMNLKVEIEKLELNKQYFSVDLDSVYLAQDGCTPVYKLSTVDAERRNRFHLGIILVLIDGTQSKTFYSRPFLLRSMKNICFRNRTSTRNKSH